MEQERGKFSDNGSLRKGIYKGIEGIIHRELLPEEHEVLKDVLTKWQHAVKKAANERYADFKAKHLGNRCK